MSELSERQKLILTLVVHEYIRTAAPVGSRFLVEHYRLDMSPATVRNEMAALTDLGYLRQPHTSAGRVPSEDGYRYFVGRLLDIDAQVADRWGQLQARAGRTLPAIDGLLAATALQHDLTLVTRNTRDFDGFAVRLINPWEG